MAGTNRGAATGQATAGRSGLLISALAYLVFVVYGSLVPLDFRPLPWEQAVERFGNMPYLALGPGSRADWVANILLFIPLCFLWTGLLWPRRILARMAVATLVFAGGFALSLAIEFAQLWFPQRTVSLNDIVAETAGAAIGIAAWAVFGERTLRWLGTLPLVSGTRNVSQRLLAVYLLVLFGYNLLPLDLTISPVEVFRKWQDGRVILLPFSTPYEDGAQRIYDLVTDIAIWVPAAALWQLAWRMARLRTWTLAVTAAAALEVLQLFVYSRVTDSTDVLMAGVGATLGIACVRAGRASTASPPTSRRAPARRAWPWLLGSVAWLAVLAVVFWYPFDFNFDRSFLHDRVAGLRRVPFEAYYFGTEFRAVTEVLRKSLFLAPLGFLLYRFGGGLPPSWPRGAVHAAMLLLIACVVAGIEAGQMLLPSKNADFTDAMLEFIGGAMGYFGSMFIAERVSETPWRPVRDA